MQQEVSKRVANYDPFNPTSGSYSFSNLRKVIYSPKFWDRSNVLVIDAESVLGQLEIGSSYWFSIMEYKIQNISGNRVMLSIDIGKGWCRCGGYLNVHHVVKNAKVGFKMVVTAEKESDDPKRRAYVVAMIDRVELKEAGVISIV